MKKTIFNQNEKGQGLVEYVILIAVIGVLSIFGLTLFGGSVEGGLLKVCAGLGNADCIDAQNQEDIVTTPTPTMQVTPTPSLVPTVTPTLTEPDPTRQPPSDSNTEPPKEEDDEEESEQEVKLIKMRIKVVLKGGGKNSNEGIQVIIYNASGDYVTKGVTDDKGNISFSVPEGDYIVATFYNGVWQKDGPITVKNSRENVIHR